MLKLPFTTALAALGLLAASQASLADAISSPAIQTPDSSAIPARMTAGGVGGGIHASPSISGPGISHGPGLAYSGRAGTYGGPLYSGRPGAYPGRAYAFHRFHHRRGFFGGPFAGYWDYDVYPYGYDGGSCYWNCREAGNGPVFCRANAWEYC